MANDEVKDRLVNRNAVNLPVSPVLDATPPTVAINNLITPKVVPSFSVGFNAERPNIGEVAGQSIMPSAS